MRGEFSPPVRADCSGCQHAEFENAAADYGRCRRHDGARRHRAGWCIFWSPPPPLGSSIDREE